MSVSNYIAGQPHAVYRAYDHEGRLLYIGFGWDPDGRMVDHRNTTDWGKRCTRVDLTWYPDRTEAEAAETTGIKAEKPLHNFQHNQEPRPVKRITIDIDPATYTALHRWLGEAGEVGEPRITLSDAVRALIGELVEGSPNLTARTRARIWAGKR